MSALQIENVSERDPHSYEVTEATHDLCNTGAMLYQLSYEASLEAVQMLTLLHNCEDHFHLYSLSAVHSYDLYHMYTSYHSLHITGIN